MLVAASTLTANIARSALKLIMTEEEKEPSELEETDVQEESDDKSEETAEKGAVGVEVGVLSDSATPSKLTASNSLTVIDNNV